MAFYRDLRLARADALLQQTALPGVEIALLTGFASVTHFTRCFSGKYGAPPGRRRQSASV